MTQSFGYRRPRPADKLARIVFGRTPTLGECVTCGKEGLTPDSFRDDLSRKEYKISCMCQDCQDKVFGTEDA